MSKDNHSRYYYVSNENMSDIKESIDEYSMNFQKQSGLYGNSRSEIQEMISGSHHISQSRPAVKSKATIKPKQTIEEQKNDIREHAEQIHGEEHKKPVYLGDQVLKIIKQRYYEINKLTTQDPEVLYNFYASQRKQLGSMKQIKNQDIEKQMPSMQRKLMVKKQFQKILTYYPDDVYYTLCCQVEKVKKDRELQQKVQYLNRGAQNDKNKKLTQKQVNKIVEKLYNTKGNFGTKEIELSPQQRQKVKRTKFGRNLSQYFQNTYRQKGSPANVETIQKLHHFWEDTYERQQYGIQWDEDTAKMTIEQYMYEQIEDLLMYANKKLGFKCAKATSLFKIYQEAASKVDNIYIPMNSFEEYVKVYNAVERRKVQQDMARTKSQQIRQKQMKKKSEAKKFGRPVSATPITILAKPKTTTTQLQQLVGKYPNDKLIKTLLTQEQLKKPRYPFEYGIYNIGEEVKVKQWVKIDPEKSKQKYQDIINNKLISTFTNPQFFNVQDKDQVMALLAQENLEKDDTWKELGPILQQAMLVKAHEQDWFRECILRYLQRITREDNKLETNQVIFKKLFNHLNNLSQNEKMSQFQKLQSLILTSQSIAQKTKKIQSLAKDSDNKNNDAKSRRLLHAMLEEKAIDYVKMRIRKTNEKFTLRKYLKELYQECMKEHKDYIKKHFNVVEGDKQCPKLLKYQFFRIVKQINPITLERERVLKNHAWVPPKQTPESFNYKTYNTFADFYTKDRNVIVAEPEKKKQKTSLWGRNKGKDRQNLIMTYEDARQCTFQPKISKKIT